MAEVAADRPFKGQLALVTGASRGIGAATARALAAAGVHVILTARDAKLLEQVEDAIHADGGHATIAPLDLTEPDGIPRLAAAIAGRWKTLDILVLSAAVMPMLSNVSQIDPKAFGRAITINTLATQAILAAFDPMLRKSADARIIGLTSSVAGKPRAFWGAYGASKAASEVLLDCYGQEVEKISNVRVAIVDPGATRTQMRAKAYPGEDPASVKPPEAVAERIVTLLAEPFLTGHRERIDG